MKIRHLWYSIDDYRQPMVKYAYDIWWMDLVILIECENGSRNPFAVWDKWHAYWLCQINDLYNKIPKEYFKDWKYQIDFCLQKRTQGTAFYWPTRKIKKTGNKCYVEVQKRFLLNK